MVDSEKWCRFKPTVFRPKSLARLPAATMYGGNILGHPRGPPDDGITPDPDELVDGDEPADNGKIFHQNVSGQGRSVGHDDLIAHPAVMGNVGIGHDEIAVAEGCRSSPFNGAAIDGDEFPDDIIVSDRHAGRLPPVADGLGSRSDRSIRKRWHRSPISVHPSTTTWESIIVSFPIWTFSPTML